MAFQAPRRLIDLIWRPVEVETEGGPDGIVFMPSIYALTADSEDAAEMLRGLLEHAVTRLELTRRLRGEVVLDAVAKFLIPAVQVHRC